MRPVQWGVLGTAAIALQRTLPAIVKTDSAVVAGIASRDKARATSAAAAFPSARVFESYDDLLSDPRIEAVYVPLPNTLHLEWCVRSLEQASTSFAKNPSAYDRRTSRV